MTKALSKLTPRDRRHYQSLKQQIKDGLWAAIEAAKKVRDEKLYLEEYATFDDFIEHELAYSRSRVYQLIKSIDGKLKLEKSNLLDISEANPRIAYEVSGVPDDQVADVIERAKGDKGKVTAASVRKAKAELIIPLEPAIVTEEVYEDVEEPASTVDPRLDAAALITAASRENDRLVNDLKRLADMVGGEWLKADLQHIIASLREVKFTINQTVFWIDCPLCKNGCKECKKIGWLSKGREKFLSTEAKAKL